jgi:hypothetical protein
VRIDFRTRGKPHLLATNRSGTLADTTMYKIVAEKGGKEAFNQMDVVTFSSDARPELSFDTDLLGEDSLIAVGTASAAAWPEAVRLDEVTGISDRPIVVSHAGKEVLIEPRGAPSRGLRGLPVSGEWKLRSGLLPGEEPGNPAKAPPDHLSLAISLACGTTGVER